MANRVFFYTDETGQKSGGRYFVVAGAAIQAYHHAIRQHLSEAEASSGKRKNDWHGTKERRQRRNYLLAALNTPHLHGRVFYGVFKDTLDYWDCTVTTLAAAVKHFGQDKDCIIIHEGFTLSGRDKLQRSIARTAERRFEIRAAHFSKEPIIRLADALAGFIGLVMFSTDATKADFYSTVPWSWFIQLK